MWPSVTETRYGPRTAHRVCTPLALLLVQLNVRHMQVVLNNIVVSKGTFAVWSRAIYEPIVCPVVHPDSMRLRVIICMQYVVSIMDVIQCIFFLAAGRGGTRKQGHVAL